MQYSVEPLSLHMVDVGKVASIKLNLFETYLYSNV